MESHNALLNTANSTWTCLYICSHSFHSLLQSSRLSVYLKIRNADLVVLMGQGSKPKVY